MNERLVSCIRDRTAVHFYQFREAREALRFFDRNPLELSERVEELDAVAGGMNGLLTACPSRDGVFVNFVLAFEEILVTKLPESRLFEDLLGQILGHKELFSPRVQQELSSYETRS